MLSETLPPGSIAWLVAIDVAPGDAIAFVQMAQECKAHADQEAGTLHYDWYLSEDRTQALLYEAFADEEAVLAHRNGRIGQELVPGLFQHATRHWFRFLTPVTEKIAQTYAPFGAQTYERLTH